MHLKKTLLSLALVVLLLLAACGPTTTTTTAPPTDTAAITTVGDTKPEETVAPETIAENDPETTETKTETETDDPEEQPAYTVSLTDMEDREITMAPAKRVVAVMPSDVEILFALGAGDKLVGRGEYADYPAEVSDIATVSSGAELNAEQIIALDPDLVLLTTMAQTVEQLEQLEKAGINVVVSNAQDIPGVYDAIHMIGALVDAEEKADAVIKDMKSRFAALEEKAKAIDEDKKGTVYFEVSPLEFGLWTSGANTFMDEIATLLGFENAFADVDGWAEISEEQVLSRDPDTIVTIAMYFGEGPKPDEEIAGRTGWDALKAVKDDRIFLANADEFSRPGPRLADGAEVLFDFFYPES